MLQTLHCFIERPPDRKTMHDHDHPHHRESAPGRADDIGAGRIGLGIGVGPRLAIWLAASALLWLAVQWAGANTP